MLRNQLKKQTAIGQFAITLIEGVILGACANAQAEQIEPSSETLQTKQPNIIFVLVDDLRFDGLGSINAKLQTPHLDQLREEGVFFENATVTTSLCSPSRASILTSQYTHEHGIVDNNTRLKEGSITFPEVLQDVGYDTALIDKWHMGGDSDEPRPGFTHWISFAGQGNYLPIDRFGNPNFLNINGERVSQTGYITDELTDYAIDWLDSREDDKPYFLYLSHKAVHSNFEPPERYQETYSETEFPLPSSASMENTVNKPLWVQNQRNSFHGLDFPYHQNEIDLEAMQRRYYGALSAIDDSVGRVMQWVEENGDPDNTIIIFTSDNGFLFGDHGLIDKRNAYEESLKVPLIVHGPETIPNGKTISAPTVNVDLAPTILELAGAKAPDAFQGLSMVPLWEEETPDWRKASLYEYYWEFNFPHTPTTFAVRTPQYKLIQYHGIWDKDELYDLQADPDELNNLIDQDGYLETVVELRQELFRLLENERGEHVVPYTYKYNEGGVFRSVNGAPTAQHPANWVRDGTEPDLRDFKITDEEKLSVTDEKELDRLRRLR